MNGRSIPLMLLLLAACSGCASPPGLLRFARAAPMVMCQHCNCLMPADLEEGTICPVCDCGHPAHRCERGR